MQHMLDVACSGWCVVYVAHVVHVVCVVHVDHVMRMVSTLF